MRRAASRGRWLKPRSAGWVRSQRSPAGPRCGPAQLRADDGVWSPKMMQDCLGRHATCRKKAIASFVTIILVYRYDCRRGAIDVANLALVRTR